MTWGGETYTLTKLLSNASIIYKNILGDNVSTSLLEPCKVKNPTKTSRMSRENCPYQASNFTQFQVQAGPFVKLTAIPIKFMKEHM